MIDSPDAEQGEVGDGACGLGLTSPAAGAGRRVGPSLLGLLLPDPAGYLFPTPVVNALGVLAQIGLVTFMFLIGLELDVRSLRGQGRRLAIVRSACSSGPRWRSPRYRCSHVCCRSPA